MQYSSAHVNVSQTCINPKTFSFVCYYITNDLDSIILHTCYIRVLFIHL